MLTNKEYNDFKILIKKIGDKKEYKGTFFFTKNSLIETKDAYTFGVAKLVSEYLDCENVYDICNNIWDKMSYDYLKKGFFGDFDKVAFCMARYGALLASLFEIPIVTIVSVSGVNINTLILRYCCLINYKEEVEKTFIEMADKQMEEYKENLGNDVKKK